MTYIYGLIDPNAHKVRYVGLTRKTLRERLSLHMCFARRGDTSPVYCWIRSLQPAKPLIVILEEVSDEAGTRYRRKDGGYFNKGASAETKWMKRFRRDILNRINTAARAYRELVNPGE